MKWKKSARSTSWEFHVMLQLGIPFSNQWNGDNPVQKGWNVITKGSDGICNDYNFILLNISVMDKKHSNSNLWILIQEMFNLSVLFAIKSSWGNSRKLSLKFFTFISMGVGYWLPYFIGPILIYCKELNNLNSTNVFPATFSMILHIFWQKWAWVPYYLKRFILFMSCIHVCWYVCFIG